MKHPNKLYYYGTEEEVRLGDRVLIKRLIFRNKLGVVFYIPGQSESHPQMKDESGLSDWAVQTDDGILWSWPYLPQEVQPTKRIKLLSRNHAFKPLNRYDELQ